MAKTLNKKSGSKKSSPGAGKRAKAGRMIYYFGTKKCDGDGSMKELLGGKGANLGELVKGVTVSGLAFEVLQTVVAVSKEFHWDLGSGHCGKGQPAKVDAGGPYIRCRATLGGEQSA